MERSAAAVQAAARLVPMVVHNGDRVTLWRAEENVRIQMAAVVQSNAGLGERVQLRVTGAGSNGDQGWLVNGIVRGSGSVEME
jgi:flagella basal body P-ring formation protein FlgA